VEPDGLEREVRAEAGLIVRLLAGAAVGAALVVPFLVLLLLVTGGSGGPAEALARLDREVADGLNAWARGRPGTVRLLEVLAVVLHPWTFRVAVAATAVVLWRSGRRRLATWALTAIAAGGLLGVLVKELVERARPVFPEPVSSAAYYSFPSGHALSSLLGCGVLLVLALPRLSPRGRVLAWAAAVAIVLVTAFDRVGLGVHFLSDVLAGWLLGAAILAGTAVGFGTWRVGQRGAVRPSGPRGSGTATPARP
jgi:membrane-associated phospholipid phosphatase